MRADPPVKSIKTTFSIIELLAEEGPTSLSTVADELDLAKSTIHDHLSTLHGEGYVDKVGQKYRVNLRFLEIGGAVRDNVELFQVAKPELQKLSNKTEEHASLMIEQGGYGVYVYTIPGNHLQQATLPIGTHTLLHLSAPGKAILAHLPAERRESIIQDRPLKSVTEHSITDLDQLYASLETIREQGYAIDDREGMRILQEIAKPVRSGEGEVLGAVCVYAPSGHANMEFLENEALKSLERATNDIEYKLQS